MTIELEDTKPEDKPEDKPDRPDEPDVHLIAFNDGSYKKLCPVEWKHSQWIHYILPNGTIVMVNPRNVNYIHRGLKS